MINISGTWWCNSCSSHFAELESDTRPEWNPDARMTFWHVYCPYCGEGEALEDAYQCQECDDFCASTDLDDDLCPTCYPIVMERECNNVFPLFP